MTLVHLAASTTPTSTGEAVAFWVLGPLAVISSVLILLSRKAVHSALWMALTMIIIAVLFVMQGAVFLGVVQIVVYTGAVMMLFLFVVMLVGVDASDSFVETLRGQRVITLLLALGFGGLLISGISRATFGNAVGVEQANTKAGGHVQALGAIIFTRFVFSFEVISALLIAAAIGAMVLTHRERLVPRRSQRDQSVDRINSDHPTPLTSPGVFARSNAVDTPGLLPDGTTTYKAVPAELRTKAPVRGAATREVGSGDEETEGGES
jgi:NADH-quinone oxidoreductase subunit J